jgi:hypothetical protein
MDFKIGDRVRVIDADDGGPSLGMVGIVLEDSTMPWTYFAGWGGNSDGPRAFDGKEPSDIWCYCEDQLALVSDEDRFIVIDDDDGEIGNCDGNTVYTTYAEALESAKECAVECPGTFVVWKAVGEASSTVTTKNYN